MNKLVLFLFLLCQWETISSKTIEVVAQSNLVLPIDDNGESSIIQKDEDVPNQEKVKNINIINTEAKNLIEKQKEGDGDLLNIHNSNQCNEPNCQRLKKYGKEMLERENLHTNRNNSEAQHESSKYVDDDNSTFHTAQLIELGVLLIFLIVLFGILAFLYFC